MANRLLRKSISALVALALVRSPRHVGRGWGPALYNSIMLGKPRGKLGSLSVHAHTTSLLGSGSRRKIALRMASKLTSFSFRETKVRRLRPQGLH